MPKLCDQPAGKIFGVGGADADSVPHNLSATYRIKITIMLAPTPHDTSVRARNWPTSIDLDGEHARGAVNVDIRAGVHTSSRATVAQAGRRWLESCKANGLEAATLESYRQHLEDHIVPYLGAVKLSQLTVPVVRHFMDKLRANRRSPAMVKRVVGDLGSILADAQERGEVAQNVVRSLSKPRSSPACGHPNCAASDGMM